MVWMFLRGRLRAFLASSTIVTAFTTKSGIRFDPCLFRGCRGFARCERRVRAGNAIRRATLRDVSWAAPRATSRRFGPGQGVRVKPRPQRLPQGRTACSGWPREDRAAPTTIARAAHLCQLRHSTSSGITGRAQICYPYGACREPTRHRLEYDMDYIKNYIVLLDLMILIQTAQVILPRKGQR